MLLSDDDLPYLNFIKFNPLKIDNKDGMDHIFLSCDRLKSLVLSKAFDTSKLAAEARRTNKNISLTYTSCNLSWKYATMIASMVRTSTY